MNALWLSKREIDALLHCIGYVPLAERPMPRTIRKLLKAYELAGGDPEEYASRTQEFRDAR